MNIESPGFFKLIDALVECKDKPEIVVEGIYRNGIWSSYDSTTMLSENHAASALGLEALMIVHLFINRFKDAVPTNQDIEGFVKNHCSPTYGWPYEYYPDFKEIREWLFPSFVTLDRIIFSPVDSRYHIDFHRLALEIEKNGIFGYHNYPRYKKYSANSSEAQHALFAVSAYYSNSTSDNPRDEVFPPEEDPVCIYGWPESDFPKFEELEAPDPPQWLDSFCQINFNRCRSFFKEDLYTVGRVLATDKASPAVIQTAFETVGVYGYDRMGRLVFHKPQPVPGLKTFLISDIQVDLASFAEPIIKRGVVDYKLFDSDAFALYGWPHDKLPDFKSIAAGSTILDAISKDPISEREESEATAVRPVQVAKEAGAEITGQQLTDASKRGYDLLILGLLAFINGEFVPKRGTDPYTKQEDLAELLRLRVESYGLSLTSIKTKFSAANALRPVASLPELKRVKRTDQLRSAHRELEANPRQRQAMDDGD
jgi:hypothetical protein